MNLFGVIFSCFFASRFTGRSGFGAALFGASASDKGNGEDREEEFKEVIHSAQRIT